MSNTSIISYIILTLAIGYAFIYSPLGDINNLLAEKQKYVDSLDKISNIESKKNDLLTKFNEIPESDKKNIETVLPSSLNFVKLISQIDTLAANYGISINNISSKEVNPSTGTLAENTEPQKTYNSSIIGFSFIASYDKFKTFLNDLEKNMRVMDIRSAQLETKENGVYSYNVEFETYWLK
jgi:Tfp pilus assembly protein PilO